MIKFKKGMIIEALMRTIIAVVLILIVLNIGKNVADAMFGGSNSLKSLENLANKLNSNELQEGFSREELISLDRGTALIGFSRGWDYECYGCGRKSSDQLESRFKRPSDHECQNSACICLCLKGLPQNRGSEQDVLDITCSRLVCKKINENIVPKIDLGEKPYRAANGRPLRHSISWQGGFLYARDAGLDGSISGLLRNSQSTIQVIIEKKSVSGITFVGVCPSLPCIKEELLTTKSNINS